ncbi:hypothetical protein [Ancylobacter koreensis]|nr:hypothetical protein [Ancylobacter koreensis]
MQHVDFEGDRILRLQTYASNGFFGKAAPLVRLDAYGNAIWLETGYDLKISAEAAEVFLRTPTGRLFSESGDEADHAQILKSPEDRRARDAFIRGIFANPTTRYQEAVAEAELNIDYGASPIFGCAA